MSAAGLGADTIRTDNATNWRCGGTHTAFIPMNIGSSVMGKMSGRFMSIYPFTERLPVVVLHWQGDEDFPPEAHMLFDRSICRFLALDVVFALAVEICIRIGGSDNKRSAGL